MKTKGELNMSDIINLHERLKQVEEVLKQLIEDLTESKDNNGVEEDLNNDENEDKNRIQTGIRRKTAD